MRVGGAERYLNEVCSRLESKHGLELSYLSADAADANGLSPARYRFMTTSFHPGWLPQTKKVIAQLKPDVLYVHHTVPGLSDLAVRAARQVGVPVALMYHGDVTGPEASKRLLGAAYHALWGAFSLRTAHTIFVNSLAYAKSSLFLKDLRTCYVAAPPGVDPAMLEGRRRSDGHFLLFVGKPEVRSKGFAVLQRAWRLLRSSWPHLELVVIGGLRPSSVLEGEGVRYLAHTASRQALADLYASAEVTVLPSTSSAESFGMVLAEALLAGCPIVGSDVGGIPALVEHGLNGYLVAPNDADALAAALDRALKHRDELRRNISLWRATYAERFNWDRTAAVVAETLAQVSSRTRK